MSDSKKPLSPFMPYLERGFRAVMAVYLMIIAFGILTTYLAPILPWIASGVVIAVTTWVTVAVIRWRRSRW